MANLNYLQYKSIIVRIYQEANVKNIKIDKIT